MIISFVAFLDLALIWSGQQILSDEDKRKSYDQFGTTTDFGSAAGGASTGFQGFQSTMDPEELFRKIFGDAGFKSSFSNFDFAESQFGFGEAEEVRVRVFEILMMMKLLCFYVVLS